MSYQDRPDATLPKDDSIGALLAVELVDRRLECGRDVAKEIIRSFVHSNLISGEKLFEGLNLDFITSDEDIEEFCRGKDLDWN